MIRSRPAVLAATMLVVTSCVGLGFWQLQRLHDRRSLNNELIRRGNEPVVSLAGLKLSGGRSDPFAYRRVSASGSFDVAHELILRARALGERAGNHVLDPLRLADGTGIIVDRGWVPLDREQPGGADFAPPRAAVSITGVLVPSEPKQILFGPTDPARGTLVTIGRIDLARLQRQVPYPLRLLYLALQEQTPGQTNALPIVAGLPAPGEGPHFAYAIQWFLIAGVALVTGIVLTRREKTA